MKKIKAMITALEFFVIVFPLFCMCEVRGGYKALMPPSSTHILGTDQLGRDILSLLLVSWHRSVVVGVLAATLGVTIASILAFFTLHGVLRDLMDTVTDVFMSVPRMFILLLLGMIIPGNTLFVASIIAILTVFPAFRVISSTLITLKSMPFMESAKAVGVSGFRLFYNYYIRPAIPTIISQWTVSVGWAVYADGGLSFLGIGDISLPGLGTMLREAISTPGIIYTSAFWWYAFPPMFLLSITTGILILGAHIHISD